MKKIGLLLSCFIILSAFTCENEPLDDGLDGFTDNNPSSSSIEGEWTLVSFDLSVNTVTDALGNVIETDIVVDSYDPNYNVVFTSNTFTTNGSYSYNTEVTVLGITTTDSYDMENVSGSGTYTTSGNEITVNGSFFEFTFDGIDDSIFNQDEQTVTYSISNGGNTLTFNQNETTVDDSSGFTVTTTQVSTSIWNRVSGNNNVNCQDAINATNQAEASYNANTSSESLCNAYVQALQNQISVCGDDNGSLQTIIDGLNCSDYSGVLLQRIEGTYNDGSTFTQIYSYSGNRLTSIDFGDGETDTFTYENGLLVRYDEVYNDPDGNTDSSYTLLDYDSQDRLITETLYSQSNVAYQKWTFAYNSDGTISVVGYMIDSSGNETVDEELDITLTNGNYVYEDGGDNTAEFVYDTKNGAMKNVYANETLVLLGIIDGLNNLVSETYYDNGVEVTSEGSTITYTYNSDDYPITAQYDFEGTAEDMSAEFFYE